MNLFQMYEKVGKENRAMVKVRFEEVKKIIN